MQHRTANLTSGGPKQRSQAKLEKWVLSIYHVLMIVNTLIARHSLQNRRVDLTIILKWIIGK